MVHRTRKLAFARAQRRAPPMTERLLWKLLRDRRLDGLKFRRQLPIDRYVVDFVCVRHRLIVEADGPHHEDQADHDQTRDAWLQAQGFRVLRFTNQAIQAFPETVLNQILAACAPNPSPLAGEGGPKGRMRGR